MLINRFFSLFLSVCPHFFLCARSVFLKKVNITTVLSLIWVRKAKYLHIIYPRCYIFSRLFFLMVNLSLFLYRLTANYQIVNQFTHSAQKSIHNWHVSKKSRSQVQIVAAGLLCVSFQCLVCGFWFTSARAPLPAYQYNCVSGECVCVCWMYIFCSHSVFIFRLILLMFFKLRDRYTQNTRVGEWRQICWERGKTGFGERRFGEGTSWESI